MKIQIIDGKVCLLWKGKTLLGICQQTFENKKFIEITQQYLYYYLKENFLPIISIFTLGKGNGIDFRLYS